MPDYAGAVAAIRLRLEANWATTPIAFVNEKEPTKTSQSGKLEPWVYFEIASDHSEIVGFGKPGSHVIRYDGRIMMHVLVPAGTGDEVATQYAVELGEIFRNRKFYDATPGYYVRTWSPWISAGLGADEDGMWFRKACIVPFEYWHRG